MEVAIIGAGMAGLAAARVLHAHGVACEVFEATDRLGGRARDLADHPGVLPIELGPEFIHGRPPSTLSLLHAARVGFDPTRGGHYRRHQGCVVPVGDIWERFGSLLAAAARQRHDESARAFLERQQLSPEDIQMFELFVEGFYAAPLGDVSIQSIAEDHSGAAGDDPPQSRVRGGYGVLVAWLVDQLRGVPIHTSSIVTAIDWTGPHVAIEHGLGTAIAERAIVTLPVGVLRADTVALRPGLGEHARALDQLAMGQVVKLVLCLEDAVWHDYAPRDLGFVHGGETGFPTYWLRSAIDAHQITAWAGGPHATALAGKNIVQIVDAALDGFAALIGMPHSKLAAAVRHHHMHDWAADPFALGAYSYTRVGGGEAAALLARPLDGRIWLAGEATDTDYEGTVAGAIASGTRAAEQILATGRAARSPRSPSRSQSR
jgi:monoamine oxidase